MTLIGLFFEKTDALLYYPRPRGWFYSSRIINEDLFLNSNGLVNVLAIRAETSSVWEKGQLRIPKVKQMRFAKRNRFL